jgi:hypothetical protein
LPDDLGALIVGDSGTISFSIDLDTGVLSSSIRSRLFRRVIGGTSSSRWGLDVLISVGEDTFARFLSGDVSATLGEILDMSTFGDGLDDPGVICLIADENCVCPNICVPPRGTEKSFAAANGFLGKAGVSNAAA